MESINKIGCGLENISGTSCFFNSINQMLYHIPEFREFIILHEFLFEGNKEIINLIKLFKLMNEKNNPKLFIEKKELNEYYLDIQEKYYFERTCNQQDAPELINKYFSGIPPSEDKNNINISLNTNKELIINNLSNNITNSDINFFYNKFNINFPIYNFIIRNKETIICTNNNIINIQYTSELFYIIKFNNDTINTIDIINIKENISNYADCEITSKKAIRENILYLNKYFIIRLNREYTKLNKEDKEIKSKTDKDDNLIIINDDKSEFYLNTLSKEEKDKYEITSDMSYHEINIPDINNYSINDSFGNKYLLIGTVCKSGPPAGGHWWYHHKINDIWYKFNDAIVTVNSEPDKKHIILLLFRKAGENYDVPNYENFKKLNEEILQKVKIYENKEVISEKDNIHEYIKILSKSSSLINNNQFTDYKSDLLEINQEYIKKIKLLL
jgi:ubiquitin C-terminal hydrolase